jgi:hypothetical protein
VLLLLGWIVALVAFTSPDWVVDKSETVYFGATSISGAQGTTGGWSGFHGHRLGRVFFVAASSGGKWCHRSAPPPLGCAVSMPFQRLVARVM